MYSYRVLATYTCTIRLRPGVHSRPGIYVVPLVPGVHPAFIRERSLYGEIIMIINLCTCIHVAAGDPFL